jgi:hypothetical protein
MFGLEGMIDDENDEDFTNTRARRRRRCSLIQDVDHKEKNKEIKLRNDLIESMGIEPKETDYDGDISSKRRTRSKRSARKGATTIDDNLVHQIALTNPLTINIDANTNSNAQLSQDSEYKLLSVTPNTVSGLNNQYVFDKESMEYNKPDQNSTSAGNDTDIIELTYNFVQPNE